MISSAIPAVVDTGFSGDLCLSRYPIIDPESSYVDRYKLADVDYTSRTVRDSESLGLSGFKFDKSGVDTFSAFIATTATLRLLRDGPSVIKVPRQQDLVATQSVHTWPDLHVESHSFSGQES